MTASKVSINVHKSLLDLSDSNLHSKYQVMAVKTKLGKKPGPEQLALSLDFLKSNATSDKDRATLDGVGNMTQLRLAIGEIF